MGKFSMLKFFLPTTDLSGGGGTTLPNNICLSFSLSNNPRKSLNLLFTENSLFLKIERDV